MRADARRNRERILAEARAALVERGIDAPLEEVAARAGVGIGTLYRHFPRREDLLEELLRERFDAVAALGRELLDDPSARDALTAWIRAFAEMNTTYRGLTDVLITTLRDETSALHASCEAMREAGTALLLRAQEAGQVRADLRPTELLVLVSGVTWAHEKTAGLAPHGLDRLLGLLFEGLGGGLSSG
ncbi:TetR/AcrR family transcriptional regulator [Actinomadura kijaniata]|uniref:TetR/AcrR family transcriptional regulator n=1 Tax=Actinomadura kijaniata TaxID=46161 RepID=UPI003F198DBA